MPSAAEAIEAMKALRMETKKSAAPETGGVPAPFSSKLGETPSLQAARMLGKGKTPLAEEAGKQSRYRSKLVLPGELDPGTSQGDPTFTSGQPRLQGDPSYGRSGLPSTLGRMTQEPQTSTAKPKKKKSETKSQPAMKVK